MFNRIKSSREASKMTQSDLARRVSEILNSPLTQQTIQKWEANTSIPRKKNLTALAKALGVSEQWLQYGEGDDSQTLKITSDEIELITLFRNASLENKLAAVQALKGLVSVPTSSIRTQINSENIGNINKIK